MTETAAPTLESNQANTVGDLIDPVQAQTMVLEDLAALRPALEKIAIDPPQYASIAHTKRFLERWSSDYRFQAKFAEAPQEILDEWNFKLTVDEARWLTDPNFIVEHPDLPMPERVREYGEWNRWKFINRDLIKLAFVRWHHDEDPEVDWPPDHDADVLRLRDRIRRRRTRRPDAV